MELSTLGTGLGACTVYLQQGAPYPGILYSPQCLQAQSRGHQGIEVTFGSRVQESLALADDLHEDERKPIQGHFRIQHQAKTLQHLHQASDPWLQAPEQHQLLFLCHFVAAGWKMLHKHQQKQVHSLDGDKPVCYPLSMGGSITRRWRTSLKTQNRGEGHNKEDLYPSLKQAAMCF